MNNLADELEHNYRNNPKKIVIIQNERKITYEDLYKKVASFSNLLKEMNIKKEQKVLVLVPMSIELYITLLSLWSIGAIPCFMDAGFIKSGMKNNEFDNINAVLGTKKYILYSNINKNLKKLKIKLDVSIINKLDNTDKLNIEEVENDFPGIYTYTSGTTGKPKIASRSHEFLKCQGNILLNNLNYEKNDVELSSVPIFTLSNINAGITTVIADGNFSNLGKSKPEKLINQIKRNNINRIMASPGLLEVIVKYAMKKNITFKNVNKIFTGGGAVFVDFINNVKKVFPIANIVTVYGSTEAEPIAECNVTNISKNDLKLISNGYGILAGNIIGVEDCKLIKYEKEELGNISEEEFEKMQVKENGEIVVTGANVLKGYVNKEGDSKNKFSVDGKVYHRTGDLGSFDDKGRLWLKGRIKEPYFDIEAALHSKFSNIGKTAVFENNGKIILVIERDCKVEIEQIKKSIEFRKIDKIVYIKRTPVDKRHSTKVNYNELRKALKI